MHSAWGLDDLPDIHQFLDGFYMSRIGIRMLIGQHIALHEPPVRAWGGRGGVAGGGGGARGRCRLGPGRRVGSPLHLTTHPTTHPLCCCRPPPPPPPPRRHSSCCHSRLQRENHIGLIDTKCSPAGVCQDAIDDARNICMREKGGAPEVSVYGDPSFTFPYVPSHLHHMVSEGRGGA